MEEDHLLFEARGVIYAMPTSFAREIVPVPALSELPETPPFVVGAFDLRGRLVPVIDLHMRLGGEQRQPSLSDQIVVAEHEGARVGLLVEAALDLASVDASLAQAPHELAHAHRTPRFLKALAKPGDHLVMILDAPKLLELTHDDTYEGPARKPFLEGVPVEVRVALRERAQQLAARADEANATSAPAAGRLAVLEVGGELVGVDASLIREFVESRGLVDVPGSPVHLAGVLNLRGAVLPVVDLRPTLELGATDADTPVLAVLDSPAGVVGVLLENVHDVLALPREPWPQDERRHRAFTSRARYEGRHVAILDIGGLLRPDVLSGNQEQEA